MEDFDQSQVFPFSRRTFLLATNADGFACIQRTKKDENKGKYSCKSDSPALVTTAKQVKVNMTNLQNREKWHITQWSTEPLMNEDNTDSVGHKLEFCLDNFQILLGFHFFLIVDLSRGNLGISLRWLLFILKGIKPVSCFQTLMEFP